MKFINILLVVCATLISYAVSTEQGHHVRALRGTSTSREELTTSAVVSLPSSVVISASSEMYSIPGIASSAEISATSSIPDLASSTDSTVPSISCSEEVESTTTISQTISVQVTTNVPSLTYAVPSLTLSSEELTTTTVEVSIMSTTTIPYIITSTVSQSESSVVTISTQSSNDAISSSASESTSFVTSTTTCDTTVFITSGVTYTRTVSRVSTPVAPPNSVPVYSGPSCIPSTVYMTVTGSVSTSGNKISTTTTNDALKGTETSSTAMIPSITSVTTWSYVVVEPSFKSFKTSASHTHVQSASSVSHGTSASASVTYSGTTAIFPTITSSSASKTEYGSFMALCGFVIVCLLI